MYSYLHSLQCRRHCRHKYFHTQIEVNLTRANRRSHVTYQLLLGWFPNWSAAIPVAVYQLAMSLREWVAEDRAVPQVSSSYLCSQHFAIVLQRMFETNCLRSRAAPHLCHHCIHNLWKYFLSESLVARIDSFPYWAFYLWMLSLHIPSRWILPWGRATMQRNHSILTPKLLWIQLVLCIRY